MNKHERMMTAEVSVPWQTGFFGQLDLTNDIQESCSKNPLAGSVITNDQKI